MHLVGVWCLLSLLTLGDAIDWNFQNPVLYPDVAGIGGGERSSSLLVFVCCGVSMAFALYSRASEMSQFSCLRVTLGPKWIEGVGNNSCICRFSHGCHNDIQSQPITHRVGVGVASRRYHRRRNCGRRCCRRNIVAPWNARVCAVHCQERTASVLRSTKPF